MGAEQSKRKQQFIDLLQGYPYKDKNNITEMEFVDQVFHYLDSFQPQNHNGYLLVSGNHLLTLYYRHLSAVSRGGLSKKEAITAIEDIHKNPKQAIQCSFRLIKTDSSSNITKDNFTSYVMNCFDRGVESILKEARCENIFKENFREWIRKNRATFLANTQKMFQDNIGSLPSEWTEGDFKRWILDRNHWSIQVQLNNNTYSIPLNIPCLFGIKLDNS